MSISGGEGKTPLTDYFVAQKRERCGPYLGINAVRDFHTACRINIEEDVPIRFTHSDLSPPNILISPGPNPKVVGIIDFGQAGWLPSYWEYAKATRSGIVEANFDFGLQEEWTEVYLPKIHDIPKEEWFDQWILFYLRNI
ncbi:phosphotransferase family [Fusarium longipes]|uniref:Phosphotransferase family n=1 Tax=Fusarium longipes TaxID=694270 RepID=A0A395SNS2_9HYPO|nr:phosphotransferase family [Fusarium longipes]